MSVSRRPGRRIEEITVMLPAPSTAETTVIRAVPSAAETTVIRAVPSAAETTVIPTVALGPRADPAATEILPRILGRQPEDSAEKGQSWARSRADSLVVGALLVVVMTVQAWNIAGFPNVTDDEGTYLAQAWAVQEGIGLGHYTYWYDHPPLGWIQLAGLSWLPALLMPDQLAVVTGRVAVLPVIAITMVLTYLLGRRLGMARWAAAGAVLAYGLSPLSVTMQRQIYLDSFAVLWMLAAFVLALSPRRHLWHHVGAGVAAGVAVLSKETIVIVVPALLVALWQGTAGTGARAFSFAGFLAGISQVVVLYPLYALLNGELFAGPDHVSLLGAVRFQLQGRPGSGSVFTAGSGAREVLDSWLYYDAVLIVAGIVAGLVALFVRRLRPVAVAVALLFAMALRPGGYLPAMYVIQALPFLAIASVGLAETSVGALLRGPHRGRRGTGVLAAQTGIAVPFSRTLRIGALLGAAVLAVVVVVPRWYEGNLRAFTADDNDHYVAARDWLRDEVPDRAAQTVVTDDVLWLDLVRAGYPRDQVIWFYKLDLDTEVAKRLDNGWRDVDMIISTPAMRGDDNALPTVDTLLVNSEPIVTFGTGEDRIEIRRVRAESR